jgi:hypothetical protein
MNTTSSLRFVAMISLLATSLFAQSAAPDIPPSSPTATLKQRVGLTDIEIVYSRPGLKGRKIFGGLEAYGLVWRTGANSPTKITFSTPVKFGGKSVPAGTYGLYSIPGDKEWSVMINKIGEKDWGAYVYKQENDVARVTAKPVALAQPVETFTIDINDIRNESATLNLIWEKTRVPVKIEVDVSEVRPKLEAFMASNAAKKPYVNAAMFYFESGGDLKKALEWVDAAIKETPSAYYFVYRKALIQQKMGDKAGALATAKASREAAEKDTQRELLSKEYVRLNDTLIASLK